MTSDIEIFLTEQELDWCLKHAEEIVEYYGGQGTKGSGSYNHNKISSNLVGVKSEVAAANWLESEFGSEVVICNYIDFKNTKLKGDMNIFAKVVEVKGLRPHHWEKFKRCIPPRQLGSYVRDDAIVIWTVTTGDCDSNSVLLKGWNYATEVHEKGRYIKTICDNIWLEDDKDMRPIESLIEVLQLESYPNQ